MKIPGEKSSPNGKDSGKDKAEKTQAGILAQVLVKLGIDPRNPFGLLIDKQLNAEFSAQMVKLIGTPYLYGGRDTKGIDCSGTVIYCLQQMGYDISTEITVKDLVSGNLDWITLCDVDKAKIGEQGVLNFYKLSGSKSFSHVDVGVGKPNNAPVNQLVDATDLDTLKKRKGAYGQVTEPKTHEVNQTYVPLSTKKESQAGLQGHINWAVLNQKYRK